MNVSRHSRTRRRVVLIQPYLPEYSVSLYEQLAQTLDNQGIDFRVVHGEPGHLHAERRDAANLAGAVSVPTTYIGRSKKTMDWKHTTRALRSLQPQYLILEHALRHIETYGHVASSYLGGPRVAWRGHGYLHSESSSPLSRRWRNQILFAGDWYFAYTPKGAKYVASVGFPPTRITVTYNSVDTVKLAEDFGRVSPIEVDEFRRRFGLTPGRTALFLGGVDALKGSEFLLSVATRVAEIQPSFRLLVAGSGLEVGRVRSAEEGGAPVRYVGRVTGKDKAVALLAADILAIPFGVGLVATDSIASAVPVISTDSPGHGPEFGYLTPPHHCVTSPATVDDYARAILSVLGDPKMLAALSSGLRELQASISIGRSLAEFSEGIQHWLRHDAAGLGRARRRRIK